MAQKRISPWPSGPNKKLVEISATIVFARDNLPNSPGPRTFVSNFMPNIPATAVPAWPMTIHAASFCMRFEFIFLNKVSKLVHGKGEYQRRKSGTLSLFYSFVNHTTVRSSPSASSTSAESEEPFLSKESEVKSKK